MNTQAGHPGEHRRVNHVHDDAGAPVERVQRGLVAKAFVVKHFVAKPDVVRRSDAGLNTKE